MAIPSGPKKGKRDTSDDDVFHAPEILREPSSKQVSLGGKIVLRVIATGRPLPSYQWFCNGTKIAGAVSDRLVISKARRNHGGAYTCEVKNFVGKVMSRGAMISFLAEPMPEIEVAPKGASVVTGNPFKFSIVSPSPEKLDKFRCQWVFNGKRIKGATGPELEFTEVKKKYEGEYKVILLAGSEIRSSNIVRLTILAHEVPPPLPEVLVAAAGEDAPEGFFFDPDEDESCAAPETIEEVKHITAASGLERKKALLERLLESFTSRQSSEKKAA